VELSPEKRSKLIPADNKVNVVELKKSVVILNSGDSLFGEIRDKNFNAINHVLSRTAKELQQANETKNRLQSVNEMRKFVEQTLRTYQAKKISLENRINIKNHVKILNNENKIYILPILRYEHSRDNKRDYCTR
jgi:hypothetical protein